ncbi:TetR family transcriptional regulator [Geobacillus sp. 46C-IIa]|uniref:TetR/AcrR family transcriptional regulator n=1 Tax=Geobacillus sp. 46C-IIa TaxID=1963025 RepID=UPI0009BDB928|nr:TetR/AcrR family transcriptional regulator [Geobacillus sp. 46C-IIa]OQP05611.1 TetR family transcriptional regulator [Geobacillus sp. 46C-IIa]QNU27220.1 TetR/AcrR family transcriptional regulator [Geobacillus sp. 46C-IIa]
MARERKFSLDELFGQTKQLLLEHGYEGFTFGLLAERLGVARSAIYKYFENKEELITAYMVNEMEHVFAKLKHIHSYPTFDEQFRFLLDFILYHNDLHKMISIGKRIPETHPKVQENKRRLEQFHERMYEELQSLIQRGKQEGKMKRHLPDQVILGYIFQSVVVPHFPGISLAEWAESIREIIMYGVMNRN